MKNVRFKQPSLPMTFSKATVNFDLPVRNKPQLRNIMELDVSYMHGDADYYTNRTYQYPNSESGINDIIDHVNFLTACKAKYQFTGCDCDGNYQDVPGYERFGADIPANSEYSSIGEAEPVEFGAVYVDKDGIEYPIILE